MPGYVEENADDNWLPLSGIQHIAFCERQWALMYLERQWEENIRTVEGKLLHKRVHENPVTEKRGDLIIARSVPLWSRLLGLYGVADVVEFHRCPDGAHHGIELPSHPGLWTPRPVEYKRGRKKPDDRDEVQLCAQAICLEEMFAVTIPEGGLFYAAMQGRIPVPLTPSLRERVKHLAKRMHEAFESGKTPPPETGRRCGLCSMENICLPRIRKKPDIAAYVRWGIEQTT